MTEIENEYNCYKKEFGLIDNNKTLDVEEKNFMLIHINKKIIKKIEKIQTRGEINDNVIYNGYDLHYKNIKNEKFKLLKIKMVFHPQFFDKNKKIKK